MRERREKGWKSEWREKESERERERERERAKESERVEKTVKSEKLELVTETLPASADEVISVLHRRTFTVTEGTGTPLISGMRACCQERKTPSFHRCI